VTEVNDTKRLWKVLATLLVVSFGILLYYGHEIYLAAPPVPAAVKTTTGQTLYTREDIETGRQVWQSIGGHEMGSIWGHGSYVAPDWSADWLHREATAVLDLWSKRETGKPYASLDPAQQASMRARLVPEMRTNTYNPDTGVVTVSEDRAAAIAATADHYLKLFSDDPSLDTLRAQYAIQQDPIPDARRREQLMAFLFWTSWSTVTNRPGKALSYTSNWPAEPLVDNRPTTGTYLWTFISIFGLLAGVGALTWYYVATHGKEPAPQVPDTDPLNALKPTPSMKATAKYFWVVTALIVVQVVLGGITAHYAVEGQGFYGIDLHHAHMAPATRGAVDRNRVARDRSVHRSGHLRSRTAVPACRRELPVHLPARHRRRGSRWTVVRRDAEDGPGGQLLVRPPGLGVRRPRPVLAGLPVRRSDPVAAARRSRAVAGAQGA
jgi:nitric oxide reductase subunit B